MAKLKVHPDYDREWVRITERFRLWHGLYEFRFIDF